MYTFSPIKTTLYLSPLTVFITFYFVFLLSIYISYHPCLTVNIWRAWFTDSSLLLSLTGSTASPDPRDRESHALLLRIVLMFLKFYRKKLKYVLDFPSGIKTIVCNNNSEINNLSNQVIVNLGTNI